MRAWAARLAPSATVLDVGAGTGMPLTEALVRAGLRVHASEPSPRLAAAFAARHPHVPLTLEAVPSARLFARRFDGILMVGVLFLLPPTAQRQTLGRLGRALRPGGSLLFSAPREAGGWTDVLTGRRSVSLGRAAYEAALGAAGLSCAETHEDRGGSHYYEAVRR